MYRHPLAHYVGEVLMEVLARARKAAAYMRCERIIRAGVVSREDFFFFSHHATNEQYRRFVRKNAVNYEKNDITLLI